MQDIRRVGHAKSKSAGPIDQLICHHAAKRLFVVLKLLVDGVGYIRPVRVGLMH